MPDRDTHNQQNASFDDNGGLSVLEQRRRWHLDRLRQAILQDDGPAAMSALDGLDELLRDDDAGRLRAA